MCELRDVFIVGAARTPIGNFLGTVKNFKALLPTDEQEDLLKGVVIASIGPITSETAKEMGFPVHITADAYTIPGLCDAILKFYGSI